MKKNTVKVLLISAAIAVVVIAAIVFSILLRSDSHGLNAFDRAKVVATAGGEKVTMGEYVMGLNNALSYYSYYGITYTPTQEMKDSIIESLLLKKLYIAKLKELGLGLTAEELASCKKTAKDQLASLEESIGQQLSTSGNFSTAALQSQINDYFTRQLGMSKAKYVAYIEEEEKAELAYEKIYAYYEEQLKSFTEEELIAFYDKTALENYGENYAAGDYSTNMSWYQQGYYSVPPLYVPENFIYVDVVRLTADTEEALNEKLAELTDPKAFTALAASSDNTADVYVGSVSIPAPFAIGENDSSYVCDYADLYATASAMEIGEIKLVTEPTTTTNDDGTETTTYTGTFILRAEGSMCENGAATGIVDIDYYSGVRDTVKEEFEASRFTDITTSWLADKQVDEAVYAYQAA